MSVTKLRLNRVGSAGSRDSLEIAYDSPTGFVAIDNDFEPISKADVESGLKKPYSIPFNVKEVFKVITINTDGLASAEHSTEGKYAVKQSRLMNAILGHPHVRTDDKNKKVKRERFYVCDELKEVDDEVAVIKKRIAVANFINSLDGAGLTNTCAYLRVLVAGKTAKQIFLTLLQERREIVTNLGKREIIEGIAYQNMDKVLGLKTDPMAELVIIVNKAVALGIVVEADGSYRYGGELIALSIDELYKYFRTNEAQYEKGLKPSVFEKDNLPVSFNTSADLGDAMKELKEISPKDPNLLEAERRGALEVRASDLGVQGNIRGMKTETLEQKIREKELFLKAKEEAVK